MTRKIFTPEEAPTRVGKPIAEAEALFKKNLVNDISAKNEAASWKELIKEGTMEARLVSRARYVTRLLQTTETILKGKGSTREEKELLREISALLDYVEFGEKL